MKLEGEELVNGEIPVVNKSEYHLLGYSGVSIGSPIVIPPSGNGPATHRAITTTRVVERTNYIPIIWPE